MNTFTYNTSLGNPVTYYELDHEWFSLHKMSLVSHINKMARIEKLTSKKINHMDYNTEVRRERAVYEVHSEEDLKPYRGSMQLRCWQPDELFDSFISIYKVPKCHRRISVMHTHQYGDIPIPEELRVLTDQAHRANVIVALTTDKELKTFLILEQLKEKHY